MEWNVVFAETSFFFFHSRHSKLRRLLLRTEHIQFIFSYFYCINLEKDRCCQLHKHVMMNRIYLLNRDWRTCCWVRIVQHIIIVVIIWSTGCRRKHYIKETCGDFFCKHTVGDSEFFFEVSCLYQIKNSLLNVTLHCTQFVTVRIIQKISLSASKMGCQYNKS